MAELSVAQFHAHFAREANEAYRQRVTDLMFGLADMAEQRTRANIKDRMSMRSRQLLTSVRSDVDVQPSELTATLEVGGDHQGLRVPYARIQEEGGTIVAKDKALAIPVGGALTGPPGHEQARAPSPRLIPHLEWKPTKGNKSVGVLVNRHTGELFFVLVRKVTIQPKWYARDAMQSIVAEMPQAIEELVSVTLTPGEA